LAKLLNAYTLIEITIYRRAETDSVLKAAMDRGRVKYRRRAPVVDVPST